MPDCEMGDPAGTRAISPSRAAPSSVSISDRSSASPSAACTSTTRPPANVTAKSFTSLPLRLSGIVARTVPSTRARWGAVKISSVGMLATLLMPMAVGAAPPIQRWLTGRPMVRSVPGPVKCRAVYWRSFRAAVRAARAALWASQAASGSGASRRTAAKMASHRRMVASSGDSSGKTRAAQAGVA